MQDHQTEPSIFYDDMPEIEELAVSVDLDPTLADFIQAVTNAADELEGQGAKSDRVASQLLTALATFHLRTSRP